MPLPVFNHNHNQKSTMMIMYSDIFQVCCYLLAFNFSCAVAVSVTNKTRNLKF